MGRWLGMGTGTRTGLGLGLGLWLGLALGLGLGPSKDEGLGDGEGDGYVTGFVGADGAGVGVADGGQVIACSSSQVMSGYVRQDGMAE